MSDKSLPDVADLKTVEQRLNQAQYEKLAEFIGDMMKITENCRYYNPPGAAVAKTAENLEAFVAQKILAVRDRILAISNKK
jgi:hypothetical protein